MYPGMYLAGVADVDHGPGAIDLTRNVPPHHHRLDILVLITVFRTWIVSWRSRLDGSRYWGGI